MSHLKQNNTSKVIAENKYSEKNYTQEDQNTWSYLYSNQLKNLQDKACFLHLNNLDKLKLPIDKIPTLIEVSNRLKIFTGWEVVEVSGLITSYEFFELLANKKFPSTLYIRNSNELGISKNPDIFHELFGHVPILMDEQHSYYIQKIGEYALEFNEKERSLLQRLYWFTYETGLINTSDGIKIYGGSLLSSIEESKHVFTNSVNKENFSIEELLSRPYRADILQYIYYIIDDFSDLFATLKSSKVLLSKINTAYNFGEYPAPFVVQNTKYENVNCCKFVLSNTMNKQTKNVG